MRIPYRQTAPENSARNKALKELALMVEDFQRLQLLSRRDRLRSSKSKKLLHGTHIFEIPDGAPALKTEYSFTQYGIDFIAAVNPRKL
jgi:hypothetical protein